MPGQRRLSPMKGRVGCHQCKIQQAATNVKQSTLLPMKARVGCHQCKIEQAVTNVKQSTLLPMKVRVGCHQCKVEQAVTNMEQAVNNAWLEKAITNVIWSRLSIMPGQRRLSPMQKVREGYHQCRKIEQAVTSGASIIGNLD